MFSNAGPMTEVLNDQHREYQLHSLAYVKVCEDQRTAARIYTQFVRDDLPLLGEPYRLEAERLAKEIWVHLDWLRENGYDRAYNPKAAA